MKSLNLLLPLSLLMSAPAALAQTDATLPESLQKLAESGSAEAAYHMGMAYNLGLNGLKKDPQKAFDYFKQAAEGGDPLGAYEFGSFYDGEGQGIVQDDPELALQHKLVAAKAGYSLAQNDVGKLLYQKDETDEAVKWLIEAGKQGYKESLQALGTLYAGEGKLPKDMGKSYAYLLLSQGGSLDKAPEKARQLLTDMRGKLTPAEKSEADTILAGWKFQPSILTLHALSGKEAAKALVARGSAPADAESAEAQSPNG